MALADIRDLSWTVLLLGKERFGDSTVLVLPGSRRFLSYALATPKVDEAYAIGFDVYWLAENAGFSREEVDTAHAKRLKGLEGHQTEEPILTSPTIKNFTVLN